MKLIVVAKANKASVNIGKVFKEKYGESTDVKLFEVKENVLDLDKYEKDFKKLKPELILVASSHKSEANIPMLNCHPTGNWDTADLGGDPRKLSIAPALYLRAGVLEYQKLKAMRKELSGYEIGMEATHHSPTIDFPVMFVEVGSTEKQWNDLAACEAAADVINKLCTDISQEPHEKKVPVAVGFGGCHYCPTFNRKLLAGEIAFGHICPKYKADALDEDLIMQTINKTEPKPDFAAIEWKGLSGPQRKKIIAVLEKNKIAWKKL